MLRRRRQVGFERLESRCMLSATVADLPVVRVDIPDADVATVDPQFTARVNIDDAWTLRGAEIHLAYDAHLMDLELENVRPGNVWTDDATELVANLDEEAGTLIVWLYRAEGLDTAAGSLLNIEFDTTGNAQPGQSTRLDLTYVRLNEDQIIVDPEPVPGEDETDGIVNFFERPAIDVQDVTRELQVGETATFEFVVQLSGPSPEEIRADFTTLDGTATIANGDYEPQSGTLVFEPGVTVRTIEVPVFGNTAPEQTRSFEVQLSNLLNVEPGRLAATGTIIGVEVPLETGVLSGFVYADTNGNYTPDYGEGYPGVLITLESAEVETRETWTDQHGWYEFRDLPEGTYHLHQRRPEALFQETDPSRMNTQDTDHHENIELAQGESRLDLHFRHLGLRPAFVYTALLTTSVQPPGSESWTELVKQIERDAQEQAGNLEDPAPPEVSPSITREDSRVVVRGTNAADQFEFRAGATTHTIRLNDETRTFPSNEVNDIRFDGGLGRDSASIVGISPEDEVDLTPKTAVLKGPGYKVTVTGTEDITVASTGPGREARVNDSPFNDRLLAEREQVRLDAGFYPQKESYYTQRVEGFERVIADSQTGEDRLLKQDLLDYVLEQSESWLTEPL